MFKIAQKQVNFISSLVRYVTIGRRRSYSIDAKQKKPQVALYGDSASPPVRFVTMTASFLGVNYEYRAIDLFKNENRTEEFEKINPLKKVPALMVNNDFVIRDSHAIAIFLADNFDVQSRLYPMNSLLRSRIHDLMFYNSSTLFPIDSAIFTSYFTKSWPLEKLTYDWYEALDYLNYNLKDRTYLACDKPTLCDLCCAATVTSVMLLLPLTEKQAKIADWLKRLQKIPCFEVNNKGLERLQSKIKEIKIHE